MDDRIIVPKTLCSMIMKYLHKGHIGISKTIHKARELFYWPNMPYDITSFIKQCRTCEKYMSGNFREPLLAHSVPKFRFYKVGADILQYAADSYLIVVDYFSHWIEIIKIKDKTSESVTNSFQEIFTRFGYPKYLIADNLPFISNHCKKYYQEKDIIIKTCSPHYHQSNGLAEKSVNISKQIIKKSLETESDYRELLMEYNNSPLVWLNASPSQILQSRILRTQLPISESKLEPKIANGIYKRLCEQKDQITLQYNNVARRNPVSFKKGDNVVVRTNKEKVWNKAVILERAKEPRSYWVKKESSGKIVRRNTSQIKMSLTKSEPKVLTEPELFPNTSEHNNVLLRNNNDLTNVTFSGISPLEMNETDDRVSVVNHSRSRAPPILEPCSRFGRPIRAPRRLNL